MAGYLLLYRPEKANIFRMSREKVADKHLGEAQREREREGERDRDREREGEKQVLPFTFYGFPS